MKHTNGVYLNVTTQRKIMLLLFIILQLIDFSETDIIENFSESFFPNTTENSLEVNVRNSTSCLKKRSFWRKHNSVFTGLYITIFVIGLIDNFMLLFIFAKHRELRTSQNVTFISVAVADIIFLIIHVGVFRFSQLFQLAVRPSSQGQVGCHIYAFCSVVACGTNAYTVCAISIQRYCGIAKFTNPRMDKLKVWLGKPVVLLSAVWVISCLLALPFTLVTEICNKSLKCFSKHLFPNGISPFIVYGLLPASVTAGFYIAAPRNVPATSNRPKMRTAKVLFAFSMVYAVTFLPPLICNIILGIVQQPIEYDAPIVLHWLISNIFFHLNPVLNPIALLMASSKIRGYFSYYFLYCCKDENHPGRWITARSNSTAVRNTDAEDHRNACAASGGFH